MKKEKIEQIKQFVKTKIEKKESFGSDDIAKEFGISNQEAMKILDKIFKK